MMFYCIISAELRQHLGHEMQTINAMSTTGLVPEPQNSKPIRIPHETTRRYLGPLFSTEYHKVQSFSLGPNDGGLVPRLDEDLVPHLHTLLDGFH